MSTPEHAVKVKVKAALRTLTRVWPWMPVQNGMGTPALDFINCVDGKFIAVETKAPGKALTPRQEITAANIRAAGGRVYVIHDKAEIEQMMQELRAF